MIFLPTYVIAIDILNRRTQTTCYNIQQNTFCDSFNVHETEGFSWIDVPRRLNQKFTNQLKANFDAFIGNIKKDNSFLNTENSIIVLSCPKHFTQEDEKELTGLLISEKIKYIAVVNESELDINGSICNQITQKIVKKHKPLCWYVIFIDGVRASDGFIHKDLNYKLPYKRNIKKELKILHSKYHAPAIEVQALYRISDENYRANYIYTKYPTNISDSSFMDFFLGKKRGYIWNISFNLTINQDWSVDIGNLNINEEYDWVWAREDADYQEQEGYRFSHQL